MNEMDNALAALRLEEKKSEDDQGQQQKTSAEHKQDVKQRKQLDAMFEKVSAEKLQKLKLVDSPFDDTTVKLYPHQIEGISWLVQNEESTEIPGWFEKEERNGQVRYKCRVTKTVVRSKPQLRGQILRYVQIFDRHLMGIKRNLVHISLNQFTFISSISDDMGLGKTIQAIGLILCRPGTTLIVAPVSVLSTWKLQIEQFSKGLKVEMFYGTNRSKVLDLVEDGEVDVLLTSYHQLVSEMKQKMEYDDMMAANEEREAEGRRRRYKVQPRTFIFDVPLFRVILDEAQEVRNPATWLFKSCCGLEAEHKLCLTGTPFVNRVNDIGSLFTFLEAEPLSDPDKFDAQVVQPIKDLKEVGLARLRTIMATISLRRSKDIIMTTLPEKTVQLVRVALTEGSQHKEVLQVFFETTRRCIIGLFQVGELGHKLGAIFGLLLRTRQAANDFHLVPGTICSLFLLLSTILPFTPLTLISVVPHLLPAYLLPARRRVIVANVAEEMKSIEDLTSPEGVALLQKLIGQLNLARQEEAEEVSSDESEGEHFSCSDDEESVNTIGSDDDVDGPKCNNCSEVLNEDTAVIIRSCQHVFCEECLDPSAGQFCPECRTAYRMSDLNRNLSSTTPMKTKTPAKTHRPKFIEEEQVLDFDEETERSPKVQALLDTIEKMPKDSKATIFSQWVGFLEIIAKELESEGYTFTRINGSMNADKRLEAMRKFSTEACDSIHTPRFILCSIRACSTGITLTRANYAFIMDPYWNLSTEEQAMDR